MDSSDDVCVFCDNEDVQYLSGVVDQFRIAPCGHQICASCYDREFEGGSAFEVKCAKCSARMRRNQLTHKSKRKLNFERTSKIRADISAEFNSSRADFASSPDYASYCEAREELIVDALHNRNTEDIEKARAENLETHKERIARNAARLADERAKIEASIAAELQARLRAKKRFERQDLIEAKKRVRMQLKQNKALLGETVAPTKDKDVDMSSSDEGSGDATTRSSVHYARPSVRAISGHRPLPQPTNEVVPFQQPTRAEMRAASPAQLVAGGFEPEALPRAYALHLASRWFRVQH